MIKISWPRWMGWGGPGKERRGELVGQSTKKPDQEEESNIIIFPRRSNIKSPAIMSLIRSGTFFEQFPGFRQDRPDGDDTQTSWLRQQRLHGREKQY